MPVVLRYNWWSLMMRGMAAVIFSACVFWTIDVLPALVLWFTGYAFVDGMFALMAAARIPQGATRWRSMLLEGAAGIATAIVTAVLMFTSSTATQIPLLLIVAIWALVRGALEFAAAVRLRSARAERLLIIMAILSVVFGMAVIVPVFTVPLYVALGVGTYAAIFGLLMMTLAAKMRGFTIAPSPRLRRA
jgi:uncharacterized membrane protein HdeD (DUF308 family)